MKIYGAKSYSELYKMLRQANGNFTLTLPDGHNYTGGGKNPQLCVTLLDANQKISGPVDIHFEDNRDSLKGIDYLFGLDRA